MLDRSIERERESFPPSKRSNNSTPALLPSYGISPVEIRGSRPCTLYSGQVISVSSYPSRVDKSTDQSQYFVSVLDNSRGRGKAQPHEEPNFVAKIDAQFEKGKGLHLVFSDWSQTLIGTWRSSVWGGECLGRGKKKPRTAHNQTR